jgi:DNA-binding MarR family transcriptional regulator
MSKSKNVSKSNRNSRNCTLRLAILNCIKAGINYCAQISKELKKKPQTIHYNVRVLMDRGYIRRATGDKRSYPVIYELADKGLILLSNAERLARGALRFHHYALKYEVVVDNPSFLPLTDGSRLRGGVLEVTGSVDGYTVRRWHAPRRDYLYLFSRILWGRFPWQLLVLASIDLDRLSHLIEQRYRMQLKYQGVLQQPHLSDPKDPFAKLWGDNYGTAILSESGTGIDASDGPWESEFSYQDAVDHVLQGRNTARIADELSRLRVLLEKLLASASTPPKGQPAAAAADLRLWL